MAIAIRQFTSRRAEVIQNIAIIALIVEISGTMTTSINLTITLILDAWYVFSTTCSAFLARRVDTVFLACDASWIMKIMTVVQSGIEGTQD